MLLTNQDDVLVWAEAQAKGRLSDQGIQANYRNALHPGNELVIWTTPPGRQVLNSTLYLFAVDPGMDELQPFTERLLGLAKYALSNTKGLVNVSTLAAATAQREKSVMGGLQWLAARGYLGVQFEDDDNACLSEGDGVPAEELEQVTQELRDQLAETAAYRRYYSSTESSVLIGQSTKE